MAELEDSLSFDGVRSNGAGWTRWTGGARPVAGDQLVEVRRRYVPGTTIVEAGAIRWSHDQYDYYGAEDVVAFRIRART